MMSVDEALKIPSEWDMQDLLLLEKGRRSVAENALVFIGMHNIAQYYWCAMYALLKSRRNELDGFMAYLEPRIRYSKHLGLIDRLPDSKEALLDIGNQITFDDVQTLLRGEIGELATRFVRLSRTFTRNGEQVMVINPGRNAEERIWYEKIAKKEGARIVDIEEFPQLRGSFLETTRAERYPTISWNFGWGRYVIAGTPDGITDRFVYEFKTTKKGFFVGFQKPVAFTQADLYGYFFRRNRKRVQIHITEDEKTETWEDNVDRARAEQVLENFSKVDAGWIPPPPKAWKCKKCDFKSSCPILGTNAR